MFLQNDQIFNLFFITVIAELKKQNHRQNIQKNIILILC